MNIRRAAIAGFMTMLHGFGAISFNKRNVNATQGAAAMARAVSANAAKSTALGC
jgi:hypothetical protein